MSEALLIPLLVAAIGVLGTYIGVSRRLSGKINTSEADSLWKESASIREGLNKRLAELESRVAKLEGINTALREENLILKADKIHLEATIESLRTRCEAIEHERDLLRRTLRRVTEIEPDERS